MTLPPDLPTGPMDPLPPRPGALDEVRRSARGRRNRRTAVLGGAVTVLLLAIALPLALRDGGDGARQDLRVADDEGRDAEVVPDVTSTSTTAVDDAASSTTTTPESHCIDYCGPGPGPWDPLAEERMSDPAWLVGRAVDPVGHPLGNITVYGRAPLPSGSSYSARTDQAGWYTLPCPTEPVVLSGVVITTFAGDHQHDTNWAPVVATAPDGGPLASVCGSGRPVVTTMQPGGVIEGTVHDPGWPQRYPDGGGGIVHWVHVELRDLPWATPEDCQGLPACFFLEVPGGYGPDFPFRAVGVPTGDHDLYVFDNDSDDVRTFTKVTVRVTAGETTHVELEVP